MNNIISEVENKTAEVKKKLKSIYSSKSKTILLFEYYKFLIGLNNKQITEAYVPEFAQDYIDHLKNFDPFCISPLITQSLIEQAEVIKNFIPDSELTRSLINANEKLKKELIKLNKILSGEIPKYSSFNKLCFPLLEENNDKTPEVSTGILETLTIKISKAKNENKFLVIPSEIKIETELKKQIETSWWQAVKVVKKYARRITEHHEVIIHFDKRAGFYRGNSLGVSLTIAFIEELLNYYNSPVVIKTGKGIALTGGLGKDGILIATSEKVIEKKVENVFFSPIQMFVVPERDLPYAEVKLKILLKEFPKRKLKLIGIKTLEDLLDSRKLVGIRKQKIVVRSSKFAKQNWIALTLFLLLAFVVAISGLWDFDRNPVNYNVKSNLLLIENKYGKLILEIPLKYSPRKHKKVDFFDINKDGYNEIFWGDNIADEGYIYSADNKLDTLWKLPLKKQLTYPNNSIADNYSFHSLSIWDRDKDQQSELYILAVSPFFSSYLMQIDINTKGATNFLVNAGHLLDIEFDDLDDDGTDEILVAGITNDWAGACFFVLNSSNFSGHTPIKNERYIIDNLSKANMAAFFSFPRSVVGENIIHDHDWAAINEITLNKNSRTIKLAIKEGTVERGEIKFYVILNYNLEIINFGTSDLYDIFARQLYKEGKVSFIADKKYFEKEYVNNIKIIK